MRKLKAPILAAAGIATLVVGLTLGTPQPAFAPPPAAVVVVNTPSNPVPTAAQGTTPVEVTNTASVTVANSAANPIPVVAQGTSAVEITNTTPLAVRDADNPARQPFQGEASVAFPAGGDTINVFFTVPAGKRLVVEHVTATIAVSPGQHALMNVMTTANGNQAVHFMSPTPQGEWIGFQVFGVSQPVRFYADAGTQVRLQANKNGTTGIGSATVSLSGHLVNN